MFGLGTGELLLVAVLALIFIGPEKLPEIATKLGKWTREIRSTIDEVKTSFTDKDKKP